MSSLYTIGQMNELADAFEADGFTADQLKMLTSRGRLTAVKAFLEGRAEIKTVDPKVITINRGCFNPTEFIGEGWSIITDETDTRSTALTELDLSKVKFDTMLKDGETRVGGEGKLKRLKESGNIRLDADVFHTLWENQHLIPESWKEKVNGNTRYIFFDGTVLWHPRGDRCVLCLCWGGGKWYWLAFWLGYDWFANNPSAVLAS